MYRHQKNEQDPTALAALTKGFANNPAEKVRQEMQIIAQSMQELPFYRQDISCYCPNFILFEQQWLGTLLTPWTMSVLVLPGPEQVWPAREIGDKITLQLPYKALTFTVSGIEAIPHYLSCSLQSPLHTALTQQQGEQLCNDCLRMLLSLPSKQDTPDQNRRNIFRSMLK
ncbi:Tat proofreading chaperone HybE [Mesocricetibacter intestinalis]|uniref:Tat proofreading chaperone HybE n=1 Tax=Mesocricetibacter intestinalis TaxID=1521930 RepID=A0A4R6VKJ3_9PAST|nr:hydrogenase-2 assembly chaperone [Mesocricetibacter intestinalis]TDQ59089.1 Tat proofreading chaperone HybE [Mesocricetibacter intestinalis]